MDVLNTLGVNPILLAGYFVNFLIVYFVLNKFVFKKALENMEIRKKLAQDLVAKTSSAQEALDEAKKEFNEIVARANNQAMEIVGRADDNAHLIAEDIKQKAQLEAQSIFEKAKKQISKERSDLKAELEKQLAVLVIETVEKIIGDLPIEQKQKVINNIDNKFSTVN